MSVRKTRNSSLSRDSNKKNLVRSASSDRKYVDGNTLSVCTSLGQHLDLFGTRSSSSISVGEFPRASKLPTRNSIQKPGGRTTLTRLGLEKKSIDRNVKRSNSNSNLFELQRLSRQSSNSLLRPGGITPLSRHTAIKAGKKSPRSSIKKDNRPISDKTWQFEQLVKVRTFISKEIPHIEYNSIKNGIALDNFIELTHNLFQLIDSRINITRENYIVKVAVNLNRYHYPTAVKPSLMKTVNTPHSWPAVLAIFSWLVDFINEINHEEPWTESLHDIVDKAAFDSFNLWNLGSQENGIEGTILSQLQQKLEKMFDVKDEDLKNLDKRISHQEATSNGLTLKKNNLVEEIESIQSNINVLNQKCDNYVKEKDELEKALCMNLIEYTEKGKILDEKLSTATKTEEHLKNLVATQPYSYAEKLQLSEEIKALRNTQALKEEKCKQQRELSNICDYKLVNLKQEIESSAYKYNGIIDELELLNAELRCLHIRDTGFANATIKQEFEQVSEMLQKFKETLTEKHGALQESLNEMVKESNQVDNELELARAQLEELSALEMELVHTMKRDEKNHNLEKESLLENLKSVCAKSQELKDKKLESLTALQEELQEKQNKFAEKKIFKEKFKNDAITFFNNMRMRMHNTLDVYQQQMRRVTDEIVNLQKRQTKVVSDALETLKEKK